MDLDQVQLFLNQDIFSIIDMSISVEDNIKLLFLASIKIFAKIGSEFFLSTMPCKWESVLKKSERDILNFISKHMIKIIKNL